jgi:hypothetical protein
MYLKCHAFEGKKTLHFGETVDIDERLGLWERRLSIKDTIRVKNRALFETRRCTIHTYLVEKIDPLSDIKP